MKAYRAHIDNNNNINNFKNNQSCRNIIKYIVRLVVTTPPTLYARCTLYTYTRSPMYTLCIRSISRAPNVPTDKAGI